MAVLFFSLLIMTAKEGIDNIRMSPKDKRKPLFTNLAR